MIDAAASQSQSDDGEFVVQFGDLGLNKPLLKALIKSGYTTPTPIQAAAIPHALNGRDLLLSAQTGSGKTAAFVLPILDKMSRKPKLEKHIHALILTPTRELALQVQDSVRRYGDGMRNMFSVPLVGGAPYGGQLRALKKGVQVVIATPGRLIDHMRAGRVDLSGLEMLILDEADRMLDMGFADDIQEILQNTPSTRQTVMSSATWDGAVGKIAESFTTNPEKIAIKVESAHIDESVYFCDDFHHKNKILQELLNNPEIKQAVIFAATKLSTEKLANQLVEAGYKARYLHGDLPQGKRNRIVADMKAGKCDLLIATDVAARGIDISAISHVINYDLPRQVEDYVHRIGRCGRAGRTGVAVNLCSIEDNRQLDQINRYLKRQMTVASIEGMEPTRNFGFEPKERRGRGKGRGRNDNRRSFGRGERQFGRERGDARTDGRFDGRDSRENHDSRESRFTRERTDSRGSRFEQSADRRFGNKDRQGERQGDGTRSQRDFYQADSRESRGNYDSRDGRESRGNYENREKRFGKAAKPAKFTAKAEFDRPKRGKFADNKFADNKTQGNPKRFDKSAGKPRPKVIEEVFFAKRQDKKAKRKFGDL
ncbi:DEAD/DEAH box helicase [Moraxella sp. ZJ142]|uniref:DEAD/DEAH box helicase n=1 Tax=Moraxella marmotae TaxID=3344520 RepID=UPI0035D4A77A